jgi:hypothetical protein
VARDPIMGDVWEEYDEHKERFRELHSKLHQSLENERSVDEEEQRIFDALDTASGEEEKTALLFEARELQARRQQFVEEARRITDEFEQIEAAQTALSARANESG